MYLKSIIFLIKNKLIFILRIYKKLFSIIFLDEFSSVIFSYASKIRVLFLIVLILDIFESSILVKNSLLIVTCKLILKCNYYFFLKSNVSK